ncbi:hypothetical protein LB450_04005 [Psychroflexus sp. CAK1W]|uniref:hypothetical protein n=1 Tax=Psychroflexus curvus TaxID=2873595 RepID=UPI001CCDD19E|nr:hypothetical protein [Psychroflexus curvus]MBZ9627261.1 hypothetical protein [Psychroflexus curvus]
MNLKNTIRISALMLVFISMISCTEDEGLTTVNLAEPSNIDASISMTQDNSGEVTFTPTGQNANEFFMNFGDGSELSDTIASGGSFTHTYAEGNYDVEVFALNFAKEMSQATKPLVVSFNPPENLDITVENDGVISNTVNVTAEADFATTFEVDFGEDGVDSVVSGDIGSTVSYTYQNPGFYDIVVTVAGAAAQTTTYVEENFAVTEILEPTVSAPEPTQPSQAVISIYSDSYDPITVNEFPTEWSDTDFEEIQLEGNNTVKYSNLAFTGIVTDYGNATDLSNMDYVHFDYWTPDAASLGFKMVNTTTDPAQEDIANIGTPIQGEWVSVDIPLNDYNMDRSNVTQLLFDALGNRATVYIDNLYFYKEIPQQPTVAAPAPSHDAANVISIYSDAYTSITVTELPTSWSGSSYEEVSVSGNSAMLFTNFDFLGIVTDYGNPTDLTGMTHVHFDYWTPNAASIGLKLVNTALDPVQEDLESVGDVSLGQWVSVDILLSDFNMDKSQVTQLIFDNLVAGDADDTVYIDNFYFYN